MTNLDDLLTSGLREAAMSLPIRPGRPRDAARRARRRQIRRRRVAAGGISAALAVGAVTAWNLTRPDPGKIRAVDGGVGVDDAETDVDAGPIAEPSGTTLALPPTSAWTWEGVEVPVAIEGPLTVDAATGEFIARTALADGRHSWVSSSDGRTWNVGADVPEELGRDSRFAAFGASLYAIGTAPSSWAATDGEQRFDPTLMRRGAAGEWTTDPNALVDADSLRERFGDDVRALPFDVAAGPRGALAAIAYSAPFSPASHPAPFTRPLPESLRQLPVYLVDGSFVGSDGVLRAPEELGLAPTDAAVYLGTPRFLLSRGGAAFTEVASPLDNPGPYASIDVIADDLGFAVIAVPELLDVNGRQRAVDATVRTSPDGITWTSYPDLVGINGARLGRVGGRLVATGHLGDGAPFSAELTSAGTWRIEAAVTPPDAVLGTLKRVTAGHSGLTATYSAVPPGVAPTGGMPANSGNDDGYGNADTDWTGTPVTHADYVLYAGMNQDIFQVRDRDNRVVGTINGGGGDPTGRVVMSSDETGVGIDVVDNAGAVVDHFSSAELASANRAENYFLVASTDRGQTWSDAPVSDLTRGEGVSPVWIEPFGNGFLVLVDSGVDSTATSSPSTTWVLIGHP